MNTSTNHEASTTLHPAKSRRSRRLLTSTIVLAMWRNRAAPRARVRQCEEMMAGEWW